MSEYRSNIKEGRHRAARVKKDMRNETANVVIDARGTVAVERVSKVKAKKVYDNGGRVIVMPCNFNIQSPWSPLIVLTGDGSSFESVINATEYYNCNNEAGKYLKYYLETV